ncbi:hypothetical protein HPB52_008669 [Rhipicephalus sanguineus]|uniref:Gag-like protein n=1 Tax=Rhipicephalus sanguineus TaxID=34632 RepID=A0A9D4QE44_RHISA|nr:hypothetical protein HPB52_008669 [Rhipicephalus sanguineus]
MSALGQKVSDTLSKFMETTEIEASEDLESSAEVSAKLTPSYIAEIDDEQLMTSDDLTVTSDQIWKPASSDDATTCVVPKRDELRETPEGIEESLDETSETTDEGTVKNNTLFKKRFGVGSATSEYQCSESTYLADVDIDGDATSEASRLEKKDLSASEADTPIDESNQIIAKVPAVSSEGRVRKRSRWGQRESEVTNVTENQPMTSQQEAEVKRKTKELRTVLLNGRILKVIAEEEDDNQASGHNVNAIAPLPDGQFYNVAAVDPKEAPRAIYRKRDTDGVPVVFTSTVADVSFWDLNPNHFARELRAVAGDEILSHRMTNHGALVLYVNTGEMARELLKLTTVAGMPVTVHVPRSYSKNMGKIRTVPFHYTNANIVTILARIGVVKARRQCKNLRMSDGTNVRYTRSNVVLTFRDDVELPSHVKLGFLRFPVEPYVEPPVMCRNCQGYWHTARACYRPPHCRTCAGPHFYTECQSKDRPRCANCRGPHTAVHFRCPARQEAYKKKRYELAHFAT